jgi:hypothetical protein
MTSDHYAESPHEAVVGASRGEERSSTLLSPLARLAGLLMSGCYLFTVVAVAIIVPLLVIWYLVS